MECETGAANAVALEGEEVLFIVAGSPSAYSSPWIIRIR